MSATLFRTPGGQAASESAPARSWALVVESEWTKIRSVRSTFWTLVATVAATIGVGAAICAAFVSNYSHLSPVERLHVDPTALSLSGIFLAQLALGVLGVLVISSEYGTGMIRATLTAVPQRGAVLAAKTAVFTAVSLVVGLVSSFIAFFVGQAILAGQGLQVSLADPGVLRAVFGGGLYLAVLGIMALAFGTILRRTAGAIAALFGLILVLPGVAGALPASWQHVVVKVLPSDAGGAVFRVHQEAYALGPWAGFGVFCAWAAALLALGWFLLARRDA